jgi:hypothetical protein
MELVEGEDLSHRIARGAIPFEEALPIARIAEALEVAHDQRIQRISSTDPTNLGFRTGSKVAEGIYRTRSARVD